jgi:hypothetical protein
LKSGYGFLDLEGDVELAIHDLNNSILKGNHKCISVEISHRPELKEREKQRDLQTRPSKSLFVTGFNPIKTTLHSLKMLFKTYGEIEFVKIVRTYAFITFVDMQSASYFY